jgi:hypothetical protein
MDKPGAVSAPTHPIPPRSLPVGKAVSAPTPTQRPQAITPGLLRAIKRRV